MDIQNTKQSCKTSEINVDDHFREVAKMVALIGNNTRCQVFLV